MNRSDLANEQATAIWTKYFEAKGFKVILTDSIKGKGLSAVTTVAKELMKDKIEKQKARGRIFVPIRNM